MKFGSIKDELKKIKHPNQKRLEEILEKRGLTKEKNKKEDIKRNNEDKKQVKQKKKEFNNKRRGLT